MAKKKPMRERDKRRLDVRLEHRVAGELIDAAEQTGVSVNQLLQKLLTWAAEHMQLGEPCRDENGILRRKDIEGVVFLGKLGRAIAELPDEARDELPEDAVDDKGQVFVVLDFTERHIIRVESRL